GRGNLWVTDGTPAGTSQLNVADALPSGLFFSVPDFTVLGSAVLFQGIDASFIKTLWITDGTSVGSRELTITGANSHGLFSSDVGPDFTVVSSRALFVGYDANAHDNLWVTDGTSAGTSEVNVAGSDASGLEPRFHRPQR